jgi:hypothetical protein
MDSLTIEDLKCPDSGHCGTCSSCPLAENCPRGYEPLPANESWTFDPAILDDISEHIHDDLEEPLLNDEAEYRAELDIWGDGDY